MILGPLVLLVALEGVLRLAHFGYSTSFFQSISVGGKKLTVENDQFSWRFFPRALARHPLPVCFSSPKPTGTYRIFVLGESAAMGDPEPAFGFSRILDVLLRERFPQARFEIINVAFTAINSHVILPIARDCARQHGDLWIVYMGHNEFQGPFGPGTVFGRHSSPLWLIRASLALKTTRLGQLLDAGRAWLSPPSAVQQSWHGLEMFLDNQLRRDDPRLLPMYHQFRENLTDILQAARRGGAEVVLCTPASNLRDNAPFASLPAPGLRQAGKEAWQEAYGPAVQAQATNNFKKAVDLFQASLQIDPQFADAQFRLGTCLLALDRPAEARKSFELARDLDTLRFRTDSRLNQIVQDTAEQWRGRGVYLCDTRTDLAQSVPDHIPGDESFFDHVHLTFEGNYALARILADQVSARLPSALRNPDIGRWADADTCARRLALTDWNRFQMADAMLRRQRQAPFTNQLNHAARDARLAAQVTELRSALNPEHLRQSAELYREALARSPEDASLHENYARVLDALGDDQAALAEFQRVVGLWPQHATAYNNLGVLLLKAGRAPEAGTYFTQALARRPDFAEAHDGLGRVQAARGDLNAAVRSYREALRCNPDSVEAQLDLGLALEKQGRLDQAEQCYLKALRARPNSAAAQLAFSELLFKQGRILDAIAPLSAAARLQPESTLAHAEAQVRERPNDALEHLKLANVQAATQHPQQALQSLQTAVRLDTNGWQARYLLGIELAAHGRLAEAQEQFAAAIRIHPDYARAHLNLGVALAKQLRLQEAAEQFTEALRLEPTNQIAQQFLEKVQAMSRPRSSR